MSQWTLMDNITGDFYEHGSEDWMRAAARKAQDAAGDSPCALIALPAAEARRSQKEIGRRMSANPPRDLTR